MVLTATGDGFCTGADLRAGRRPAPPRPEGAPDRIMGDASRMIRRGAQRLISAVLDCEKPVVGAVNGTAAGIGAHLAFACDLVVAAEGARFIEVFVRRGISPDGGGAYLLPRLIGLQKAKELIFFGDDLHAADAAALGLVNRVVPRDQLERRRRRAGRAPGGRAHQGHRHGQVAAQPLARVGPPHRLRRGGVGPGIDRGHRRRRRGAAGLRRAPRPRNSRGTEPAAAARHGLRRSGGPK